MPVAAACAALALGLLIQRPTGVPPPPAGVSHTVDIDQIERALDDMDMLRQVGLTSPGLESSSKPEL